MDDNPANQNNLQNAMFQLLQVQLEQQRQDREEDRQQQRQERELQRALLQQQLDQQGLLLQSLNIRPQRTQPPPPPPVKSLPVPSLSSPEDLTTAQFRIWRTKWDDYSSAQQLQNQSLATQHGVLRSALHDNWVALWSSQRFDIDYRTSVAHILNQFEAYIRQRRNPLLDRQEFLRRDQHEGESVDQYYAALRLLDDACSHELDVRCPNGHEVRYAMCEQGDCFGQDVHLLPMLQQTRIRERLICGLRNKETQRKILAEQYNNSSLTIESVLTICSAHERSELTTSRLAPANPPSSSVHAVKSQYRKGQEFQRGRSPGRHQPQPQRRSASNFRATVGSHSSSSPCENCGFPINPNVTHRCPAQNQECTKCRRIGHWARTCRDQSPRPARSPERRSPPPPSSRYVPRTSVVRVNSAQQDLNRTLLPITVTVGDFQQPINFLCDTGADADIMDEKSYTWISFYVDMSRIVSIDVPQTQTANNSDLPLVCKFPAALHLNGRSYQPDMFVSNDIDEPILSKRGCEALGLIPPRWPHSVVPAESIPQLYVPVVSTISSATRVLQTESVTVDSDACLIKSRLIEEFNDVFDDEILRPMKGPPMKIEIVPGATPSKKYKAYSVPIHWQKIVKEQLDCMEKKGVIERVPVGESYEWCHPMVVVPKKGSNEPRITVDLTGLNKFVRRPAYPARVPREVVANIPPGQKFFTTLDARHGYWQIPLDEDSKKLTTFITPWGSYRYCRNVMGLISAGDEHNRRGDEAIKGIANTAKVVEDVLIHDEDLSTHVDRVREVLQRCREHAITLNAKKFSFAQPQTEWCGFTLNKDGYSLAPHLVSAIRNFPIPASKTDIRSFMGLVQQFESFSSNIAELSEPLRALLPKNTAFVWETPHQQAFENTIAELSSPRVLAHFTPGMPLRLETDAAQSRGLGYALWQRQQSGEWRMLRCGSRYVTPTESNYSPTEIELLAVVWAVRKCRLFLLGQPFELVVDHSPLTRIIDAKTLDQIENPRLQRLKEKLSLYQIHTTWRKGTLHTVVDVFSRYPVSQPEPDDSIDEADPAKVLRVSVTDSSDGSAIIPDRAIESVKEVAYSSVSYQKLIRAVQSGLPEHQWQDSDLAPYRKLIDDLYILDGLVMYGTRIVIPSIMRRHILDLLHSSHQGIERTLRRARQAVFWPGITNDIKSTVQSCHPCQTFLPSLPKEPIKSNLHAEFPFHIVAVDLFSYAGNEYLVVVDKYSGWPSVTKLGSKASTQAVTSFLLHTFTDTGIPEILISDNGPQFASHEFANWCAKWKITHQTSSPHFPQSNGLAESAVKAMKYLLAKTSPRGDCTSEDFRYGLLEFRNTPRADGYSPAQIVLGAPTRTLLPLHRRQYDRQWRDMLRERDAKATKLEATADARYNLHARPLAELSVGDVVRLQDPNTRRWDTLAEIVEAHDPRSFQLRTEAGRILRRNRRFVRPYHASTESTLVPANPPAQTLRRSPRQHNTRVSSVMDIGHDPRSRTAKGDIGIGRVMSPQLNQTRPRSILKSSLAWNRTERKSYAEAVRGKQVQFQVDLIREELNRNGERL